MLERASLPRRVHRLEDEQHRPAVLRVELVLELGEELDAFPPELKYPAVALLGQMVTEAGTRNVLSAESLVDKVQDEEDVPTEQLELALDRLESESKLVRRERRRGAADGTRGSQSDWARGGDVADPP